MITETPTSKSGVHFDVLAAGIRARFAGAECAPLFTTDSGDLVELYLANLPVEERQHHTCHCCRRFLEQYGGLVTIEHDGNIRSALWSMDSIPHMYQDAVAALIKQVERSSVTGVFVSREKNLGQFEAGGFTHFSLVHTSLHDSLVLTDYQITAAKREDFGTLNRALAEFTKDQIAQALTLLEADSLYRSEKVIGPAKWLMEVHGRREGLRGKRKDNITWLYVATAPAGFCTPRSSMIGTLLEDIAAGYSFETVKRRFDAKMHPLQYQRPQAAASAGNIAQAEKIVEKMGIARSLERRFARLDEIQAIWRPAEEPAAEAKGGVFGHLQAKGEAKVEPLTMRPQAITFEKFRRTVLAGAKKIELHLQSNMNFCAMITAVHADAPPILQWDREDQRNPFSWYVWNGGSRPEQWGLRAGTWANVSAIALKPSMLVDEDGHGHQAKSANFLLEGARESRTDSGLALFPETLRGELHSIRATIEQFSKAGKLQGAEEQSANGVQISSGTPHYKSAHIVRVTGQHGVATYTIDRWD